MLVQIRAPLTGSGVRRSRRVPSPSWPDPFRPQQLAAPSVVIPQVCDQEALRPVHAPDVAAGAATGTGCGWTRWSAFPSCPSSLAPQHQAEPSVRTPQLCRPPTVTLAQVLSVPTRTGRPATLGVLPIPSCPWSLSPQHHSEPSVRVAQVWNQPVLTDAHAASRPVPVPVPTPTPVPTRTGCGLGAPRPVPSCPKLSRPQHHSVPSWRIPQVVAPLVLIVAQEVSVPTRTGVVRAARVPSPSWPKVLRPQHHAE